MELSTLELPVAPTLSNAAYALEGVLSGADIDNWFAHVIRQGKLACDELLATLETGATFNAFSEPDVAEARLALESRYKDSAMVRRRLSEAASVLAELAAGGEPELGHARSSQEFLQELTDELTSRSQLARRLGYYR